LREGKLRRRLVADYLSVDTQDSGGQSLAVLSFPDEKHLCFSNKVLTGDFREDYDDQN